METMLKRPSKASLQRIEDQHKAGIRKQYRKTATEIIARKDKRRIYTNECLFSDFRARIRIKSNKDEQIRSESN